MSANGERHRQEPANSGQSLAALNRARLVLSLGSLNVWVRRGPQAFTRAIKLSLAIHMSGLVWAMAYSRYKRLEAAQLRMLSVLFDVRQQSGQSGSSTCIELVIGEGTPMIPS